MRPPGREQATDRRQRGRRVLDVVQDEERHREVEWIAWRWIGHEVELDRRDLRQVRGGQLLRDNGQHPIGRFGQHELADVVEEGQPEQPGPSPDVDDAVRPCQLDGRPDRVRRIGRARDPLRRIPVPRPLVEGAHDRE